MTHAPGSFALSPLLAQAPLAHPQVDLTFSAPWEARAFALVVSLSQAGHFSWPDWVGAFSQEIAEAETAAAAGGPEQGYYQNWLTACEHLLADKGVVSRDELAHALDAAYSIHDSHDHPDHVQD